MNTAQLLESLPRFIDELKRHGYSIGTDEAVNAHKIILKNHLQRDEHQLLDDVESHASYWQLTLSPIFCSTEEQQQCFRQHLDNWLTLNSSFDSETDIDHSDKTDPPKGFSWPAVILVIVALTLGISSFFVSPTPTPTENPASTQQDSSNTATPTEIAPRQNPRSERENREIEDANKESSFDKLTGSWLGDNDIRSLMLAGMLICAGIALLLWYRRRPQITRGSTDGQETTPFSLNQWIGNLHAPIATRKSIQRLRVHELVRTNTLDIDASIRATIARGGLFHPITGTRPQLPEFVLLIESNSVNDHQRAYSMQWYHYLLDQGLIVTPYWYTGAPWQGLFDEQGHRLSWQQLVSQNSQKRLLVMGDAEQWFHPITGQLPSQTQDIGEFSRAALLTPKAVIDWDNHEWQFQQLGLTPFHFDVLGIQQLSNYWQQDQQHVEYAVSSRDRGFPSILENYQTADYLDLDFVKEVVASLEAYLSPQCFKLLCATAIYPECHFGITRHLAADYLGDLSSFNGLDELSPLCRLPWMRRGVMPDNLRLLLLNKLDRHELNQLRENLAQNLKLDDNDSASLRLRRFLAPSSLTQRWLRTLIGGGEHSNFSRDVIFVKIMSGSSPLRLTLASAAAQRWNKIVQHRWFITAIVTLTVTISISGLFDALSELPNWISIAANEFSYVGFFLALAVTTFFTSEFYRNRQLPFRNIVKLGSTILIALNLSYLALSEISDSIELATSLPYHQCVILITALYLQQQINLPLRNLQSNSGVIDALASIPLKTLARWFITLGIALTAFNLLFGNSLISLITRDQVLWSTSGEPLGALPNLASDFSSSLFVASMVAAIAYSLRPYLGWPHRQALHVAKISIAVKFLLIAVMGGFFVFLSPFVNDTSDFLFLKAITNSSMSYPAAVIALGIQGAMLGFFDRTTVLKKGGQFIVFFTFIAIAYYPLARVLTPQGPLIPQLGIAHFAFGGFLAYCLLIGFIKRNTTRPLIDAVSLLFSLLVIVALSTVLPMIFSGVLKSSIGTSIAMGLLPTLIFTPAAAVIFLTYLQRRMKQPAVESARSEFSAATQSDAAKESVKPGALPWWSWALLFLCGISFSGLLLYWEDSSFSAYSEALLYLATLLIGIAHRHSLRRAFILITITALASMIALPALVPAVQVFGQSLEADTWLNLATLLCCLWFSRFLSTHWQSNHLSLPHYDSLWRPLGLLLLTSIAVDWYVTENIGIGWGLAWLPVWVLVFIGRSFSRTLLWASGFFLCMLLTASSGVNAWLQESLGIDNLYLNLGLYGVALSTIPMAIFLGHWLSKSDRLLSAGGSTLKILLPLLLLCLVDLDYSSDWPIDDSYYNLNGSIELAHAIMFALGFISRRHMNYGVAALAVVMLANTGQWINETYAAEAPQAVELEQQQQQQQELQKRPLPPTLYTLSKSDRQPQLSDSDTAKTLDESPDTKKGAVSTKDEVSNGEPMKIEKITPPKTFWEELLTSLEISFEVPVIIILSLFLSGLAGQWLRHKLPPRFSSGATMKHATSSREETKQYAKR